MSRNKRDITSTEINDNILNGGKSIYLNPKRNQVSSVLKSVNHDFNPDIHVMIPNPNGKGFIQRLK